MTKFRIRSAIQDFDPYVPGRSIEEIREAYGLTRVVKLASNENPLGSPPLAQKQLARHADHCHMYPRNHSPRLARALAERHGVDPSRIVVANGSDECIDLLFRVTAEPGRANAIGYEHAFSMYRLTAGLCGVEWREVERDAGLALPTRAMARAADKDTALVFLTSPDNPTGLAATPEAQAELAHALPDGALLVVDEAYGEFAGDGPEDPDGAGASLIRRVAEFDNLVILRTFSKAFGLAGLRLGWMILPEGLAGYVNRARIPFTVNLAAQEAGLAALEDGYFLRATLEAVVQGRDYLAEKLDGLGCRVTPSRANFLMFAPPDGSQAKEVCGELLKRGVIVRHLASFGLPGHIRVSVGKPEENEFFIRALSGVLDG